MVAPSIPPKQQRTRTVRAIWESLQESEKPEFALEQQFRSDRMQVEAVERKVAAIVAAIEEGHYSRVLGDRLAALERQQDSLLARVSETPPTSVRLHPRLADVYAEKVQQLEDALNDPAIRDEAADVLRSLIDRIELHPRDCDKGVDATLHGALAQILTLCGGTDGKGKLPEAGTSGSQLSVVAGARNHLDLQLRGLLATVIGSGGPMGGNPTSRLPTSAPG